MFQIITHEIKQEAKEMEKQILKRSLLITEIRNVMKKLHEVSDMEDIIADLTKHISVLETEQGQYIQMLQALNLIVTYYNECDKRIVSRSELGDYWSFKISFKKTDFSSIAHELKKLQS